MYNSNEDNESIHSDDSQINDPTQRDRLETLMNMEFKHSDIYFDLRSKSNLLKVDLENLYTSCQRFESQTKNKGDLLEEYNEKLVEYQKRNKIHLKEKLSSITKDLEETNKLFYEAFDNYSSEVLMNSINVIVKKTEKLEKQLAKNTEVLDSLESKGKIKESLMKPKQLQTAISIETVVNELSESSMKRPEIRLETTSLKMANEIKKLEQELQEMKSISGKRNK